MGGRRRRKEFKYLERSEANVEVICAGMRTLVRIGVTLTENLGISMPGQIFFDRRASLEPRKFFAFTDSEAEISWNRDCRDAF